MDQPAATLTDRRFWRSVLVFWLIASTIMIAACWTMIADWRFPDPDDQLRLVEVRDWLAGQRWSDVTQYRLNAPAGVPMHWSRLVDLPIAGVIVALRPFVSSSLAETAALVVVPVMTLGAVLAALATLARRLLVDEAALLATYLSVLCVDVVHQLRPMRIDHHGWQMALAVIAAAALTGGGRRAGLIAGSAAALWLSISLEGLPMVAAILALAALRWAIDPADKALLRGTVTSAAVLAAVVFLATHPATAWRASFCDALSPFHLAMLAVGALGIGIVTALPLTTVTQRAASLGIAGLLALAPLAVIAPQCAASPFAGLDPLVRDQWYLRVMEGLPIWVQSPATAIGTIAVPLIGLIGAARAVIRNRGDDRRRWASLLFLMLAATSTAVLVQRSAGVANLFAMPGVLCLVYPMLLKARTIRSSGRRIVATLATLMIATPGLAADVAIGAITANSAAGLRTASVRRAQRCTDGREMAALTALPRGNILAPLDIAPSILVLTPHRSVASGHHRGAAAMHDVIAAFMGTPAAAEAIVRRRRIDYVAFCPGLAEVLMDEEVAPHGFLAMLDTGNVPIWLQRVPVAGSPVKVWRVR